MLAHILVVDDQPYLCELLSRIFIRDRYHIVCTNNAGSTEKYLMNSIPPDIVLLEISLHGFDGWDLLHYIKSNHPDLPVLIVTSYDNYSSDPRTFQADGYILKDFIHLNLLKKRIIKILMLKKHAKVNYPGIEENPILPLPLPSLYSQSART